jgi:hypothetical protein
MSFVIPGAKGSIVTFGTSLRLAALVAVAVTAGCKKKPPAPGPVPAAGDDKNTPIAHLQLPPAGGQGQPGGGQPVAGAAGPANDLYGDQGGEQTLAVEQAPPDAPRRCRKTDAFFKLSNPRLEAARFPRPGQLLAVDYVRSRNGWAAGIELILRSPDGKTGTVHLLRQLDQSGTIHVESRFGPFNQLPQNAELYLLLNDARYPGRPTFKVSNSVALGNVTGTTLARNWTAQEADTLRKEPPPPPKLKSYDTPNQHPNVGTDTELVGETTGGVPLRYVDPDKPLLGFDYWMASWENEPSPAGFVAVFSADQPGGMPPFKRVIAKDGYAVGAVTVYTKKYVNALKLTYFKLKPDGSLDPTDKYDGDLIGTKAAGGKEVVLGGDGKRVIGFHCRKGAILNSFGIVLER